jgi:hypothetical protein
MIKNLDELCDEEKSFFEWMNNQDDINNQLFDLLKIVYVQGYAAGFQYKQEQNAMEQLQK